MFSANQLKKALKQALPAPLLERIQAARRSRHKRDPALILAEERFHALNASLPAGEIAMRPGMVWNIDPQSRDPFTWFCYQSPDMVAEFDLFLRTRAGRTRFLDLGANHGVFSLAFTSGRPDARALALDPSPLAFPVLQHNVRLNPECRITPLQIAAGSAAGELRMKFNWHHLEVIADQTAVESDEIKIVPVRAVDSVCEEHGFRPDLVKVDVEGHELATLQGMDKVLREDRPEFFIEIHPVAIDELGYRVNDITGYLDGLGYEFRSLNGESRSLSWVNDQIHVFWAVCQPKHQRI